MSLYVCVRSLLESSSVSTASSVWISQLCRSTMDLHLAGGNRSKANILNGASWSYQTEDFPCPVSMLKVGFSFSVCSAL